MNVSSTPTTEKLGSKSLPKMAKPSEKPRESATNPELAANGERGGNFVSTATGSVSAGLNQQADGKGAQLNALA